MKKRFVIFASAFSMVFVCNAAALDLLKNLGKVVDQKKEAVSQPVAPDAKEPVSSPAALSSASGTVRAQAGFFVDLPAGWKVAEDAAGSFRIECSSVIGAGVSVIVNDYGSGFPVEQSLAAYKQSAQDEKNSAAIESFQEISLGKAKGVQRVEVIPSSQSDPCRITFQGYAGTVGINVVASSQAKDFKAIRTVLESILLSMKW